jgi:predicted O-linked N-acetylglucosamine transferase (SPINDLY family)
MQDFSSNNFNGAITSLDETLKNDNNSAENIFEFGLAYARANKLSEASTIFNCLLKFKKSDIRIPYNLGLIYSLQSKHQLALETYDLALKINPDDVEALINKGSTCNDVRDYILALESLNKAIYISPDIPEAWSNKGIALNNLNLHEQSIAAYKEAINLNPQYYEAWLNKSAPLNALKRFSDALESCDKALSIKPDYAEAWSNKGVTLNELRRYDEAIAHYEKALSIKPDIDWVAGDLLHAKMKICSWSTLADDYEHIGKKVLANERVATPFSLLALSDDPLLHKKSSEIYINSKHPFNPALGPVLKRPTSGKIRLGYFSADFHNHATGYLMAELFELHDKSRYELVGFSFGPVTNDEMRKRLKQSFKHFVEVGDKSDIEIARLTRDLNIDIAVDLKGFTQDSRTGIFSYRAAPIQVNYLGYPGTIGADFIDYILADKTIIPESHQHFYSEKMVYLPDSYQSNDRKRIISDKMFTRKELGLPDNAFVFCCFNNSFKILPATFLSWMRVLKAVEGSVLWLFQENPWVVRNLKKEAENFGVDPDRLIFAGRMPLSEHLARHRQANLFLDTLPYNAHTTASDALWAGLPVLSLMGSTFASRVAASLLNAMDLPELVTNTEQQYESLAIELAINPQKLADIKLRLVKNLLSAPLFNTPRFTKNLETAYQKMYEIHRAGMPAEHIYIP